SGEAYLVKRDGRDYPNRADIMVQPVFKGDSGSRILSGLLKDPIGSQAVLKSMLFACLPQLALEHILGCNDHGFRNKYLVLEGNFVKNVASFDIAYLLRRVNYLWEIEDVRQGMTELNLVYVLEEFKTLEGRICLLSEIEKRYLTTWYLIRNNSIVLEEIIDEYYPRNTAVEAKALLRERLAQGPFIFLDEIYRALLLDYRVRGFYKGALGRILPVIDEERISSLITAFNETSAIKISGTRLLHYARAGQEEGKEAELLDMFRGILSPAIMEIDPSVGSRISMNNMSGFIERAAVSCGQAAEIDFDNEISAIAGEAETVIKALKTARLEGTKELYDGGERVSFLEFLRQGAAGIGENFINTREIAVFMNGKRISDSRGSEYILTAEEIGNAGISFRLLREPDACLSSEVFTLQKRYGIDDALFVWIGLNEVSFSDCGDKVDLSKRTIASQMMRYLKGCLPARARFVFYPLENYPTRRYLGSSFGLGRQGNPVRLSDGLSVYEGFSGTVKNDISLDEVIAAATMGRLAGIAGLSSYKMFAYGLTGIEAFKWLLKNTYCGTVMPFTLIAAKSKGDYDGGIWNNHAAAQYPIRMDSALPEIYLSYVNKWGGVLGFQDVSVDADNPPELGNGRVLGDITHRDAGRDGCRGIQWTAEGSSSLTNAFVIVRDGGSAASFAVGLVGSLDNYFGPGYGAVFLFVIVYFIAGNIKHSRDCVRLQRIETACSMDIHSFSLRRFVFDVFLNLVFIDYVCMFAATCIFWGQLSWPFSWIFAVFRVDFMFLSVSYLILFGSEMFRYLLARAAGVKEFVFIVQGKYSRVAYPREEIRDAVLSRRIFAAVNISGIALSVVLAVCIAAVIGINELFIGGILIFLNEMNLRRDYLPEPLRGMFESMEALGIRFIVLLSGLIFKVYIHSRSLSARIKENVADIRLSLCLRRLSGAALTAKDGTEYSLYLKGKAAAAETNFYLRRESDKTVSHDWVFQVKRKRPGEISIAIIFGSTNFLGGGGDLTNKGIGSQIMERLSEVIPEDMKVVLEVDNEEARHHIYLNYRIDGKEVRRNADNFQVVDAEDAPAGAVTLRQVLFGTYWGRVLEKSGFSIAEVTCTISGTDEYKGVEALRAAIGYGDPEKMLVYPFNITAMKQPADSDGGVEWKEKLSGLFLKLIDSLIELRRESTEDTWIRVNDLAHEVSLLIMQDSRPRDLLYLEGREVRALFPFLLGSDNAVILDAICRFGEFYSLPGAGREERRLNNPDGGKGRIINNGEYLDDRNFPVNYPSILQELDNWLEEQWNDEKWDGDALSEELIFFDSIGPEGRDDDQPRVLFLSGREKIAGRFFVYLSRI
ncbi:MAG: hypothetical protein PHT95_05260, partial [Candidatus Omnitrophica bacterium]|nr:hypothetical protein [Candidatus Omnitrophota bacterium]